MKEDRWKADDYEAQINWTGNTGAGTSSYESYERDLKILHPDKPLVPGSADLAFRRDPRRYSPEGLLVTSLSACDMLWYLDLCGDARIVVISYEDRASGQMTVDGDGGHFPTAVSRSALGVEPGSDLEAAMHLHKEVHRMCFIANSVNFSVRFEPTLEEAGSTAHAGNGWKEGVASALGARAPE